MEVKWDMVAVPMTTVPTDGAVVPIVQVEEALEEEVLAVAVPERHSKSRYGM